MKINLKINKLAFLLEQYPNLIITRERCGYCDKAKLLLQKQDIRYYEFVNTQDMELTGQIQRTLNYFTYPMIFLKRTFIRGHDDLKRMVETGEIKFYRENREGLRKKDVFCPIYN